jgi:hypothetical protein
MHEGNTVLLYSSASHKVSHRGRKLKGGWVLVRTRGADSRSWLLIKQRDTAATRDDVLERQPRSILSRRFMAEIAFEAGGEVERAADADPPAAIRTALRSARTRRRVPRPQQSAVWHSSRLR